jgi:acyl carrier protein
VADWLARHGAGEIVLVSRSGVGADIADPRHAALDAIRQHGSTVHVAIADAGDADSLSALMSRFGTEWKPLRGVIHAAVQMSGAPIVELAHEALQSMRASKVQSARLLDQFVADAQLDFFVLYSSTTSLLGVHGLAHYAAANQYLDALAAYRRAQGRTALAVAWGTWDVMRVASADAQATIARGGMRQMSTSTALERLGALIGGGDTFAMVADVDWSTLVPLYEARRTRPLIHALAARASTAAQARVAASPSETSRITAIRAARADARLPMLQQLVRREVATVLGYANDDGIPLEFGFFELGLDSLMSVELKRRLESAVEAALPSTLTFNYPNVAALAVFLRETLFDSTPVAVADTLPPKPIDALVRDDDSLTDDELEARLMAKLAELR